MAVLPAPTMPFRIPRPKNQAEAKREQIRDLVFPNSAQDIYDRKVHNGFSSIPRTLGLMLTLIEHLAPKGKNPSRVYSELWFRTFDDKLVEVKDEEEFAYASGLSVRRWRERIDVLEDLGFIRVAANGNRRYGYILLRNPNNVVLEMKHKPDSLIPREWWTAYTKRCVEIGYQVVQS
jgi:hypothetical protein